MQRKSDVNVLIFLLVLLDPVLLYPVLAQDGPVDGAARTADGPGADGSAFFALRSCHQSLSSDSGEFFSPDYLCSNPPLWCNWTIQVEPGKRIHLHLEDLTPDQTCSFKQDQVHVDEPLGHQGSHKVLQKCWQEAKYTSSSNTLYVVLLIGGWPSPSYRGFHGRYQAFGPPVIFNPGEGGTQRLQDLDPDLELDLGDSGDLDPELGSTLNGDQTESENPDLSYDYYDQHVSMTAGLPWGPLPEDDHAELGENFYQSSNYSHMFQFMATPTDQPSPHRTFRSGRGVALSQSDPVVVPASPQQRRSTRHQTGVKPTTEAPAGTPSSAVDGAAAVAGGEEKPPGQPEPTAAASERAADAEPEESRVSNQRPPSPDGSERQHNDQGRPRHNPAEPRPEHRGNPSARNHSEIPHLPGDHLYEVAIEVNFSQDLEESWDNLARSLLLSVKALISKQLDALHKHLTLSSKRIKRLNTGALFILWLQIGPGSGGVQVHRAVHSAMQGLLTGTSNLRVNRRTAVIMSVSTADVNECGTQMVLCDSSADCQNHFGSYSCHCRPGFQDRSRLGSGGTLCVETEPAGCAAPSPETKAVYVLFFLLSSLMVALLAAAAALHRRRRRGGFLVRCRSGASFSPPDPNNNHLPPEQQHYCSPPDADLPPPPPARAPREVWAPLKERRPPVDLPLLRFSPLLPPDTYTDPQDAAKQ